MSKDIHILELSAYEQPIIKESKREDWVEFGVDNNYYKTYDWENCGSIT